MPDKFGAGDATLRLKVAGNVVFEQRLTGAGTSKAKIDIELEATRELTLELDANGSINCDWLVLLSPAYR